METTTPDGVPVANIYPIKFEKRYDMNPDGTVKKESDWVTWAKKGVGIAQETKDKVERVKRDPMLWNAIAKHYEAWKDGQEFETDGTPLDVWPGLESHQVELIKRHKCFSVEDLANMTDGDVGRLGFPGARERRDAARKFINNRASIDQVDALRKRIAELEAKTAEAKTGSEPKRGPGRPRKAEA